VTGAARFPATAAAAIGTSPMLSIRAGSRHRYIRIWAVVAEGRVFVRSWSLKPRSWYRTFLAEPTGSIRLDGRAIAVRAVRTRSARLLRAVDRAYLRKYASPGAARYARDLCRPISRQTTIELVPR